MATAQATACPKARLQRCSCLMHMGMRHTQLGSAGRASSWVGIMPQAAARAPELVLGYLRPGGGLRRPTMHLQLRLALLARMTCAATGCWLTCTSRPALRQRQRRTPAPRPLLRQVLRPWGLLLAAAVAAVLAGAPRDHLRMMGQAARPPAGEHPVTRCQCRLAVRWKVSVRPPCLFVTVLFASVFSWTGLPQKRKLSYVNV